MQRHVSTCLGGLGVQDPDVAIIGPGHEQGAIPAEAQLAHRQGEAARKPLVLQVCRVVQLHGGVEGGVTVLLGLAVG